MRANVPKLHELHELHNRRRVADAFERLCWIIRISPTCYRA